jgi:hypothetical protein
MSADSINKIQFWVLNFIWYAFIFILLFFRRVLLTKIMWFLCGDLKNWLILMGLINLSWLWLCTEHFIFLILGSTPNKVLFWFTSCVYFNKWEYFRLRHEDSCGSGRMAWVTFSAYSKDDDWGRLTSDDSCNGCTFTYTLGERCCLWADARSVILYLAAAVMLSVCAGFDHFF